MKIEVGGEDLVRDSVFCPIIRFFISLNVKSLIDVFTFINEEKTRELQAMPKYAKFNKWLEANGVKHPGVDYPVAFGKQG